MMEEQNVGRAGAGTGIVPGPLRNCSEAPGTPDLTELQINTPVTGQAGATITTIINYNASHHICGSD